MGVSENELRVMVAIVSNRQVRPKTVLSLMRLISYTKYIEIYPFIAEEGYTTGENRTVCVIEAIRRKCTHLLFIDDDMIFPENTLIELLWHDKDIVGVWSFSRILPLSPTMMFLNEKGEYLPQDHMSEEQLKRRTELFECYAVGMGVALINMKVFMEEKLKKPWFNFRVHELGKVLTGEDAWFCEKAREAGYKVWCNPTLSIGHLGEYNYADTKH